MISVPTVNCDTTNNSSIDIPTLLDWFDISVNLNNSPSELNLWLSFIIILLDIFKPLFDKSFTILANKLIELISSILLTLSVKFSITFLVIKKLLTSDWIQYFCT